MTKLNFYESRLFGRVCYGYARDEEGMVYVKYEEAEIVRMMFKMSAECHSLQSIQSELLKRGVKSPSGRDRWTRNVIDKTINNKKYIPYIISFEEYLMARGEKEIRCRNERSLLF